MEKAKVKIFDFICNFKYRNDTFTFENVELFSIFYMPTISFFFK